MYQFLQSIKEFFTCATMAIVVLIIIGLILFVTWGLFC